MINQNLLLTGDDGYNLTKSLRFRSSASAYLNRTPASASNRKTYTWSGWVKLGKLTNTYGRSVLLSSTDNGGANNFFTLSFETNSSLAGGYAPLRMLQYTSGAKVLDRQSTSIYRDPSAWYHVVMAVDMTQSTATNRQRVYVNGVEVTSWTNTTTLAQNTDTWINYNQSHQVGIWTDDTGTAFDGYMAEVNFIDGQALTPSSFGETDALTGVWKPKKYAGTYGTNGFYLPFTNTASTTALGYDFSGNSNNWTTNNFSISSNSTYDSMKDVPTLTSATTANYCVMNPLEMLSGMNLTQGNLNCVATSGYDTAVKATMPIPSSGKYYWEILDVSQGNRGWMGIYHTNRQLTSSLIATTPYDISYGPWDGKIYAQSGTSSGTYSTSTTGDIVMFAIDADNGRMYVGKNGTWFNSGVPASGTGYVASLTSGQQYSPWFGETGGTVTTVNFNFGQRPFSYTPPTGFVALNTFNLPEPSIKAGNKYMDATTYSGNGTSQTITNASGFAPDFVWIKGRNYADNHTLWNTVVGAQKSLSSDTTTAETTRANALTAFASNGFTLGTDTIVNYSAGTYVGWQWKANGTGSSNTAGSITSTVSANPTAGFSVVTFTATGSSATIGHGLGVAPAVVIVKDRASSGNWAMYHQSLPSAAYYLYMNTTAAQGNTAQIWNSTAPTSSVFSIGTWHTADAQVAYCFAEVAGYSKFGSYTGNGSTDGTFVHTGFRPKFVMIKQSSASGENWTMYDSARNTYNSTNSVLFADTSSAEFTSTSYVPIDLVSNGFKIRTDGAGRNANGATYIYMAFAENPFKYSLAR